jgi:hypothetical protein
MYRHPFGGDEDQGPFLSWAKVEKYIGVKEPKAQRVVYACHIPHLNAAV